MVPTCSGEIKAMLAQFLDDAANETQQLNGQQQQQVGAMLLARAISNATSEPDAAQTC